jgi:hypothetical protein
VARQSFLRTLLKLIQECGNWLRPGCQSVRPGSEKFVAATMKMRFVNSARLALWFLVARNTDHESGLPMIQQLHAGIENPYPDRKVWLRGRGSQLPQHLGVGIELRPVLSAMGEEKLLYG